VPAADRQICIAAAAGQPGASLGVPVTLDDGGGVAGFQVDVGFDPALLSLAGVRPGSGVVAAGGWSVLHSVPEPGRVRVLGVSGAGVGLTPGFKEIALLDYRVEASSPIVRVPSPLQGCVLSDELGRAVPCHACVQPGVDAAFPRYAQVTVEDAAGFRPALVPVEPGDRVAWLNLGPALVHTTTSGTGCSPGGAWHASLLPGGRFARIFPGPPGPEPYFCVPHCAGGQAAEVRVTEPILLRATHAPGAVFLDWTGGQPPYLMFRSGNPAFVGTGQAVFEPAGGPGGTTLTDGEEPEPGASLYYLVVSRY
jgi:plastocyanin